MTTESDPRHIFFDLDGTLIGSSGDVKPDVWEALEPLRERYGFSVCTGRPRAGVARRVAEKLDPGGLHIFENGGMVTPASDEPVSVSALGREDLSRLATRAKELDATIEFYTTDGIFVSRLSEDCAEHARAIGIKVAEADLFGVIEERDVVRAHWVIRQPLVEAVLAIPLVDAELGMASSPVLPGMVFGSVTRKGTSKGSAATTVAELLGFDLKDAIGIGDAPGDEPLLQVVGHPYVVENSPAELREKYPVLGHVDEHGVVEFLRSL